MNDERRAWFVTVRSGDRRKSFIALAQTERSAKMQVSKTGCQGWQVLRCAPITWSHAWKIFDNGKGADVVIASPDGAEQPESGA